MKLFKLIVLLLFPILSFSQELFTQNEININEGLKTKQGKYLKMSDYVIRYSDATPEELYDKTEDVFEWTNLAYNAEYKDLIIQFRKELDERLK